MRKHTLSLCLSLVLLFVSIVPMTVLAQDSVCDDVIALAGQELKAPDDADSELIAVLLFHERALEELADGDYADSVSTLTRAIDLDPIYADSYLYRGCANIGVGDRDLALDDFSKVQRSRPGYPFYGSLRSGVRDGVRQTGLKDPDAIADRQPRRRPPLDPVSDRLRL